MPTTNRLRPGEFDAALQKQTSVRIKIEGHVRNRLLRMGVISDRKNPTLEDLSRAVAFLAAEEVFSPPEARLITDFTTMGRAGPSALEALGAFVRSAPQQLVKSLVDRMVIVASNTRIHSERSLALLGIAADLADGEMKEELERQFYLASGAIEMELRKAADKIAVMRAAKGL